MSVSSQLRTVHECLVLRSYSMPLRLSFIYRITPYEVTLAGYRILED